MKIKLRTQSRKKKTARELKRRKETCVQNIIKHQMMMRNKRHSYCELMFTTVGGGWEIVLFYFFLFSIPLYAYIVSRTAHIQKPHLIRYMHVTKVSFMFVRRVYIPSSIHTTD